MARRRVLEQPVKPASSVPPELFDHGSPVWRDRKLFDAWCRKNVGRALDDRETTDWCLRFGVALSEWTKQNDMFVGSERFHELGLRPCRRLRPDPWKIAP